MFEKRGRGERFKGVVWEAKGRGSCKSAIRGGLKQELRIKKKGDHTTELEVLMGVLRGIYKITQKTNRLGPELRKEWGIS